MNKWTNVLVHLSFSLSWFLLFSTLKKAYSQKQEHLYFFNKIIISLVQFDSVDHFICPAVYQRLSTVSAKHCDRNVYANKASFTFVTIKNGRNTRNGLDQLTTASHTRLGLIDTLVCTWLVDRYHWDVYMKTIIGALSGFCSGGEQLLQARNR